MDEVSETELFSAYLDGELTAEEQVRVEQILATSAVARQLLEELRALENTLQGLPLEKLDEDLSPRVLEIAERRMLLPAETADDSSAKPSAGRAANRLISTDPDSTDWSGIPWREVSWRGMLSKRALIWSAVVVATGIIISVTSGPPQKPNREMAKSDETPAASSPDAGEGLRKISKSERNWDAPAGPSGRVRVDDRLARKESRDLTADRDLTAGEGKLADNKDLKEQVAMDAITLDGTESALRRDLDERAGRLGAHGNPAGRADKVPGVGGGGARGKSAAGKLADGEAAKSVLSSKSPDTLGSLALSKKAADYDEKKDAGARAPLVAGIQPALAPAAMPAQPTPPPPTQLAVVAKPAAEPPPAIAAYIVPSANKTANAPQAAEANGAAMPQAAQGKGAFGNTETANQTVTQGAGNMALMNGTGYASNSALHFNDSVTAGNFQGGQVAGKRAGGQETPPATVVRLDVSTRAMQNQVFEKLLKDNGLDAGQNATERERFGFNLGTNVQYKPDLNIPAEAAATNSLRGIPRNVPPEKPADSPDVAKSLKQQSLDYSFQLGQKKEKQGDAPANSPQPIVYACEASPQQLDGVLTQIRGDKSGVYSVPQVEAGNPVLPVANSAAQNNFYSDINSAPGGFGGGVTYRQVEQKQAKAAAKAPADGASIAQSVAEQPQAAQIQTEQLQTQQARTQSAQSQQAPPASAPIPPAGQRVAPSSAAVQVLQQGRAMNSASQAAPRSGGAAKQLVFFVLNVVDRVAPAADLAPPAPAASAAPATPAKQVSPVTPASPSGPAKQ